MAVQEFNRGGKSVSAHEVTEEKEYSGLLSIGSDGIGFQRTGGFTPKQSFQVRWSEVTDVEVDGAEALQSRVTVTRLFLVGIFAFALKKKTGDVYAYVQTATGYHLVRVPKKTAPELRALFAPFRIKMGKADNYGQVASPDQVPCDRCGAMVNFTSVKCLNCGAFRDGR